MMGSISENPLRVVIVGAGFCGLTVAIECKRRGMHPILVEAYSGPSTHGDLLDFVPNGGKVFYSWDDGRIGDAMFETGVNRGKNLEFYNQRDQLLRLDPFPGGAEELKGTLAGHRGEFHRIVYEYAQEIGVEIQASKKVVQYLDTDSERGVLLESGEKMLGDAVLACDGPKSLARSQLLGLPESKVNSGYAIFRAYFNVTDEMKKNPYMADLSREHEDTTKFWVGPDMHGFIYTWRNGRLVKSSCWHLILCSAADRSYRDCAWVLTHLDDADIGESWSLPGKKEDVIHHLRKAGFPPIWNDIVEMTPEDRLIDYKLVWRDPLKTWLSPSKRCAVMGDAAHCHLPTSAQGACMAVEDAVTMAVCLEKAEGDVPLAMQVFERIRFNRSHVIHQASISTRDIYHKNDWTPEMVEKNPDSLIMPLFDWIMFFDPKKNAEEHFDHLAEEVKSGKKGTIQQLSLPAGGDYSSMGIKITA